MKLRAESFREQFRKKDLSKLAFRKVWGYHFMKEDKEDPNHGWILTKDDTSAVIKMLSYTDGNRCVMYSKCSELKNVNDLEAAVNELKVLWSDENNRKPVPYKNSKPKKS